MNNFLYIEHVGRKKHHSMAEIETQKWMRDKTSDLSVGQNGRFW